MAKNANAALYAVMKRWMTGGWGWNWLTDSDRSTHIFDPMFGFEVGQNPLILLPPFHIVALLAGTRLLYILKKKRDSNPKFTLKQERSVHEQRDLTWNDKKEDETELKLQKISNHPFISVFHRWSVSINFGAWANNCCPNIVLNGYFSEFSVLYVTNNQPCIVPALRLSAAVCRPFAAMQSIHSLSLHSNAAPTSCAPGIKIINTYTSSLIFMVLIVF